MISSSFKGMKLPSYTQDEINKKMTLKDAYELLNGLGEISSDTFSVATLESSIYNPELDYHEMTFKHESTEFPVLANFKEIFA